MPRIPRCLFLTALAIVQWSTVAVADPQAPRNLDAKVGTNLERVGPVSRSWPFVDVFKSSTGWSAQKSDGTPWTGAPLAVDSSGWVTGLEPQQVAVARVLQGGGTHYVAGQYVALYDGVGTLDFSGDASVVSSAPGRIVVQINPSTTSYTRIRLMATDPADPLRNLRLVMPGFESTYATQVFHPEFLQRLAPFRVIRFLNWTVSNDSPLVSWSQRTRVNAATQGSIYGVAPEYLVDLANRLDADVWINIPHLADDDYVTRLATLLRDTLEPDLRVFVEHSNELWGVFQQSDYARQQGLAQGLSSDPLVAAMRWHSARSVHIFGLFESVFGPGPRLVRVLGASHANPATGLEVMNWQNAYLHADALTTAPYFGGPLGNAANGAATAAMTPAQLLAALDQQSQIADGYTQTQHSNAAAHGLGYIAYEGGQALYGQSGWQNDPAFAAAIIAVNHDPGMRPLYLAHLNRWAASGGGLFMNFNLMGAWNGGGCWGVYEDQQQDPSTAYKLLGVYDYMAPELMSAPVPARSASSGLRLSAAPNPFRNQSALRLELPRAGAADVVALDAAGRSVRLLFRGALPAGATTLRWDGRDDSGAAVPAGLYFARAACGGATATSKVILTRD